MVHKTFLVSIVHNYIISHNGSRSRAPLNVLHLSKFSDHFYQNVFHCLSGSHPLTVPHLNHTSSIAPLPYHNVNSSLRCIGNTLGHETIDNGQHPSNDKIYGNSSASCSLTCRQRYNLWMIRC